MIRLAAFSALLTLLSGISASGAEKSRCDRPFQVNFRNGSELRLDIRSGDIEITGSNEDSVSVTCEVKDHEGDAADIAVTFDDSGKSGRLQISGGPKNHVRLRIRVPRNSSLIVRCPAGDMNVTGVTGHKDISLKAGDLDIDVGNPNDYRLAEASVKAGDVNASAFGVRKGGLFRSFRHENRSGKYRLSASLWAGEITLRGSR